MRIAVYSGSFDPLHIGHKAIMEYLTQTSDFDWVYLVISPQNPFKDKDKALNAVQRYRAAVDAGLGHVVQQLLPQHKLHVVLRNQVCRTFNAFFRAPAHLLLRGSGAGAVKNSENPGGKCLSIFELTDLLKCTKHTVLHGVFRILPVLQFKKRVAV